jgi:hypothetical protein
MGHILPALEAPMQICTATRLEHAHIEALLSGEVLALRIPEYFPTGVCHAIADRLKESALLGQYVNAPLIERVGEAFFETISSQESENHYWNHAAEWIKQLRAHCAPMLTPIDKLRLDLDELWPAGATIQTLDGKKMFVGLVRVFGPESYAEPHQDHLEWNSVHCEQATNLISQLSGNIYLRLPPRGGDLNIWESSLSKLDYSQHKRLDSYGLDLDLNVSEALRIVPREGDLIIFNSRMIHSVTSCEDGERITWSTFIGWQGADHPLTLWS